GGGGGWGVDAVAAVEGGGGDDGGGRRRGVAARGARAAGEELADHWVPGRVHGSSSEAMDRRFCATATRTRLDRGSQHRDRVPVVGGTHRTRRRDGGRVRPAQGRCHCDALRRTSRR